MKSYFLIILVGILLVTSRVAATPDIPLEAQGGASCALGGMILIADSGSMGAIIEHPEFANWKSDSRLKDSSYKIPSIIFQVSSGSSSPTENTHLKIKWIEWDEDYRGNPNSEVPWQGNFGNPNGERPLRDYEQLKLVSNGGGKSQFALFNTSFSVRGDDAFKVNNIAKHLGVTITDSAGNEQLFIDHVTGRSSGSDTDYDRLTTDTWTEPDLSNIYQPVTTRVFAVSEGEYNYNGRRVTLGKGLYRIEYLRWIFFFATQNELDSLPQNGRIQTIKNVLSQLVNSATTATYGLASSNRTKMTNPYMNNWGSAFGTAITNAYPIIRAPLYTEKAPMLERIGHLTAGAAGIPDADGRPWGYAYLETLRYINGELQDFGNTSPINKEAPLDLIIITDGLPSSEKAHKFKGSWVPDYNGEGDELQSSNNACHSAGAAADEICASFLDDAASLALEHDFAPSQEGKQFVRTHVIGLGFQHPFLDKLAASGGTGKAHNAVTEADLLGIFKGTSGPTVISPIAGAAPAVSEHLWDPTYFVRSRFSADFWTGNVDVFTVDETGEMEFLHDVAEVFATRDLAATPRVIKYGIPVDSLGRSVAQGDFTSTAASALRDNLFSRFAGGLDTTLLADHLESMNTQAAQDLINFVRGEAVSDLRIRDRNGDGGHADLGDFVHSQPTVVEPASSNLYYLSGYADFVAGQGEQPPVFLIGGNDGMLHAFHLTTGEELWGFIPASLLSVLEELSRLDYNVAYRRPYVDGEIAVRDAYVDGSWRKLAMFGLRAGGSSYTVLDISDRTNPQLLFEVSDPSQLGLSWSRPEVVLTGGSGNNPSSFNWHMVVAGGEGKASEGNFLGVYPLTKGTLPSPHFLQIEANAPAGTRLTSIRALQNDSDIVHDRIYVGSESGNVYRVELAPEPSSWTVKKLFSGSTERPVTRRLETVLVDHPEYNDDEPSQTKTVAIGVYWGTGRLDTRDDIQLMMTNQQDIVGLFDPVDVAQDNFVGALENVTRTDLGVQSGSSYQIQRKKNAAGAEVYKVTAEKAKGFVIPLAATTTMGSAFLEPAGFLSGEPRNVRGAVLFPLSLPPSEDSCGNEPGQGFLLTIDSRSGGGVIVDGAQASQGFFYQGGVPDVNQDGAYTSADVESGYSKKVVRPLLDIRQSGGQTDGLLDVNDINFHAASGGVKPAMSPFGQIGLAHTPAIAMRQDRVLLQGNYVEEPEGGASVSGEGSGTSPTPLSSQDISTPSLKVIDIYEIVPRLFNYHEVSAR